MNPQNLWILRTASGLECHVLSYGAVLQRLRVPVGPELRDVVLGLPTEADYV
ncbi:MAG: galactose-1-epimerase, partial [Flavobacteriia bacterium]|nr:galactose-1-epimerase [Flavobacteriia bacterium]